MKAKIWLYFSCKDTITRKLAHSHFMPAPSGAFICRWLRINGAALALHSRHHKAFKVIIVARLHSKIDSPRVPLISFFLLAGINEKCVIHSIARTFPRLKKGIE